MNKPQITIKTKDNQIFPCPNFYLDYSRYLNELTNDFENDATVEVAFSAAEIELFIATITKLAAVQLTDIDINFPFYYEPKEYVKTQGETVESIFLDLKSDDVLSLLNVADFFQSKVVEDICLLRLVDVIKENNKETLLSKADEKFVKLKYKSLFDVPNGMSGESLDSLIETLSDN